MSKFILVVALNITGTSVSSHNFDTFEACRSAERVVWDMVEEYDAKNISAHVACIRDDIISPTYTNLHNDQPTKEKVEFEGENDPPKDADK